MSRVLYCANTLTLEAADSFVRYIWRQLLKIRSPTYVTTGVVSLPTKSWNITSWLGHTEQQCGLAAVLDGAPLGHHRWVGRPKLCWIDGITRQSGLSVAEQLYSDAKADIYSLRNFSPKYLRCSIPKHSILCHQLSWACLYTHSFSSFLYLQDNFSFYTNFGSLFSASLIFIC